MHQVHDGLQGIEVFQQGAASGSGDGVRRARLAAHEGFLAFDVTDFLKFLQMRAERAVGRLQHASERREIPGSLCLQRGQHAQAYRSVNGRIEVGRESEVEDLQTVNGKIRIAGDVKIDGDIESVNGSIRCRSGLSPYRYNTAIHGRIELERTTVELDIHTTNGDITLEDNTKVKGDIVVEGKKGSGRDTSHLDIKISGNSVVEGKIIVKDRRRNVRVYLSNGGRVLGKVENAEVINE